MKSAVTLGFLLLLVTACENDFSPKAEYEERIVVYSILDRSAPYQVVRLERTYNAENSDPASAVDTEPVTEAQVTVTSDQQRFIFRDTLITLGDGSTKKVWISRELQPTERREYTLTVEVPGYKRITAQATVPTRSYAQFQVVPGAVRVTATPSNVSPASGYYFRLWVVGSKTVDGQEVEVRREVPVYFNSETGAYEYPNPSRDSQEAFPTSLLQTIHSQMREEDGVSGRDLVGVAYSMDQYLYSFFKLARGFDDPVSVRQDRPDVSNIVNGVGIFGSMYPDSVRVRFSSIIQQ